MELPSPFYYARYVDWIFTTPLMLWDLLELAGASWQVIFMVCSLDILMIACGIIGSLLITSSVKWVFFVLGCVFFVMMVQELQRSMGKSEYGPQAQKVMTQACALTVISWTAYPVVWGLTEGGNIVGINLACLLYAILDVVSKCVFGFIIVGNREAVDAIYNQKAGYGSVNN